MLFRSEKFIFKNKNYNFLELYQIFINNNNYILNDFLFKIKFNNNFKIYNIIKYLNLNYDNYNLNLNLINSLNFQITIVNILNYLIIQNNDLNYYKTFIYNFIYLFFSDNLNNNIYFNYLNKLNNFIFYNNLETALDKTKPEAVLAFGSIHEHLKVVKAAAPRRSRNDVTAPLMSWYHHTTYYVVWLPATCLS